MSPQRPSPIGSVQFEDRGPYVDNATLNSGHAPAGAQLNACHASEQQQPVSPKSAVKERLIKHHHKTRLGCMKCKERKIKCDESKPSCFNCQRSDNVCEYRMPAIRKRRFRSNTSRPSSASRAPKSASPSGSHYNGINGTPTSTASSGSEFDDGSIDPFSGEVSLRSQPGDSGPLFDMTHMELLHHWSTYTSATISGSPELRLLWRSTIVEIGLANDYALFMLLTFSARHLGKIRRQKERYYRALATNLEAKALQLANAAKILPNVTEENCTGVIVFSSFVFMNSLASLPADIKSYDWSLISQWLKLLRGVVQVTASAQTWLYVSEIAPLLTSGSNKSATPPARPSAAVAQINRLAEYIEQTDLSDADKVIHKEVVQFLKQSFEEQHLAAKESCLQACIFRWPALVPIEYQDALEKGHPVARVIFTFWTVLFAKLRPCWWIEGWPEYILASVHASLDYRYRLWMQWPMEELQWMATT